MALCPHCKANELVLSREVARNKCIICENVENCNSDRPIETDLPIINIEKNYPKHKEHKRIIIPPKIWNKMAYHCVLAPGEISGFGEVKYVGENVIIKDIFLLKQINSVVGTKIGKQTFHEIVYKLGLRGQSTENWRCWWHTHDFWEVGWSDTDERNIKNLQKNYFGKFFSVELNKRGEFISRMDENFKRYEIDLVVPKVKRDDKLRIKCQKQINRLITNEKIEVIEVD